MKPIGLYLHVPFCQSKCPYCDFYSFGDVRTLDDPRLDAYTTALCRAVETAPADAGEMLDTVYFGGGTPLLLGPRRIAAVMEAVGNRFSLCAPEVTLEANPYLPGLPNLGELLPAVRQAGINRISFGVQSGVPRRLEMLGRAHTVEDAAAAVAAARQAGIANLSLDLMLGLPGQTVEELAQSVAFCTELLPEHLSAYILKLEPGTPFAGQYGEADIDEDSQADLYLWMVEALEKRGYAQYEISNFARLGYESRHNLKYWRCQPYLGVGPAASSFLPRGGGERFAFPRNLAAFLAAPDPWTLPESEGPGGEFTEYAMLALRLREGLSRRETLERYPGVDWAALWQRAAPLVKAGLVRDGGERISLTPEGMLLSNSVIAHLVLE